MSYWGYRVIKTVEGEEEVYGIHEVHYAVKLPGKEPKDLWTQNLMKPWGYTLEGLTKDLKSMLSALDKPVLEIKNGELVEIK